MSNYGSITDITGIKVGHYTDLDNGTGCTALISDMQMSAGIEIRGAAPGSKETALLDPLASHKWINGILLSGGSAFGLGASNGVMDFLEEKKIGIKYGRSVIPIVPSAVVFDLGFINHKIRPDKNAGYIAASTAQKKFSTGNFGAGTGCTVGKILGKKFSIKSGIGTSCVKISNGIKVGSLVAVNAFGSIFDSKNGKIIAGPKSSKSFLDTNEILINNPPKKRKTFFTNTTIGIVATNAILDKIQATRLAMAGQDGIALSIRPSHTANDGDTIFGISTNESKKEVNIDEIHSAALESINYAIKNALENAESLGGVDSSKKAISEFDI